VEDRRKRLDRLAAEAAALEREAAAGAPHGERLAELRSEQQRLTAEIAALERRFEAEKALVAEIIQLREELDAQREAEKAIDRAADTGEPAKPAAKTSRRKSTKPVATPQQQALQTKLDALAALQAQDGEAGAMVPMQVDGQVVAEIIAGWTGIPLGKMVKDEIRTVLALQPQLQARVIGQDHALAAVAQRVRTARANLEDPNKPKGVFLFVGPSGVGKTETALALADILYGGEKKLITLNMSEYQEAHTVSGLKGSPPGYVGYGEGGVLTEAVRRQPYSVVLLDEVEKAHPDVLEMFFQVFDKGVMDDAEGREIDFRNTLIILTSNVASGQIMQACLNKPAEELPGADELAEAIRPALYKAFKPAFIGRMKVVPYYPVSDDTLERIIRLKLDRIAERVAVQHKARLTYDDALVEAVLARCTEVDTGARAVDHILSGTLLPQMAEAVLTHMADGEAIAAITVTATESGDFAYTVEAA